MIIGFGNSTYNDNRNIIENVAGWTYRSVASSNFYNYLHSAQKRIFGKIYVHCRNRYREIRKTNVEVLHFWNAVSFSGKPWVVTFESLVPRFKQAKGLHGLYLRRLSRRSVKKLAAENCLALIAVSESAKKMEMDYLDQFPKYKESIIAKLHVIHPPQEIIAQEGALKRFTNLPLHFVFVGSSFFRKGGREIYEVFSELKDKYKFSLSLVSNLVKDDYATKETDEEILEMRSKLKAAYWIDHYDSLPNTKVLNLINTAHVGLLPTWADTYGYSVLEFQAAGCPVISTDVRALVEINNSECGWMIELPKDAYGEALYKSSEERLHLSETIKEQLREILVPILENRENLPLKSQLCLNRIRRNHSPAQVDEKLKSIYLSANEMKYSKA